MVVADISVADLLAVLGEKSGCGGAMEVQQYDTYLNSYASVDAVDLEVKDGDKFKVVCVYIVQYVYTQQKIRTYQDGKILLRNKINFLSFTKMWLALKDLGQYIGHKI